MKKGISVVAFVVLTSTYFVGITFIPNAEAGTLYVGGSGPGNYTSIQSAIDAADSGDTVFVYSGTYYENLLVSKSIRLIGQNKDSTVVDAFGTGTVVNVDGARAYIEGLTITGSGHGSWDAGIGVLSGRLDVRSSRISNSHYGIYVSYSGNSIIADSLIHSNWLQGIYLSDASGNIVSNNTIVDNGAGVAVGGTSFDNIITDNLISSSEYDAISLGGLLGMSPSRNTVTGNTISGNGGGVFLHNAYDNIMTDNNIMNNDQQAFVRSDEPDYCPYNQWDYNYWSDYNGSDSDGDGIGDTPYQIDCLDITGTPHYNNYDPHPRMSTTGTIPIGGLELNGAILSGERLENVRLSWSVSLGNRSVIGFEVYRGSTYDAQGLGYGLTAFLPSDSSTFTDVGAGDGNPGNYFYRVCALDIFDGEVCATDQGAKYTRSLNRGPRLISFPLIQSNESIEYVLQTVEYDKAWYYDSSSQEWRWHMTSKGYRRGLWSVNHTMGLWVNVTGDCNFTTAGIVPSQTTIHLYKGWNLVGFPSFNTTYAVMDLKAETSATRVEGYDSTPPYYLTVLSDGQVLQAGYSYWARMETDTVWIISVE